MWIHIQLFGTKTEKAISNAKRVEKHHLELGQALDTENCNLYKGVYKVV